MAVKRDKAKSKAVFQVGLNVTLKGSKKMSVEEQDAMVAVEQVRVIIVAADEPVTIATGANTLVDTVLDATAFSTGSVGYKLHIRDIEFSG